VGARGFGAALTNYWLRRPDRVEDAAREAVRMAEEMSLALWHAWGLIHLGAALCRQGKDTGLTEIEAGFDETKRIGAARYDPLHHSFAAEAYAHAGRRPGLGVVGRVDQGDSVAI
jgi:hypothetical protein